ncbi:MAG: hypothetical protein H6Q33_1316 [Deltaproteobacteria bacterium]|nr:hypothetical protein [Deltaproteobacteria bacterium]
MITHRQGMAGPVEKCIGRMQAIARRGRATSVELAVLADWLGSECKVIQRCAARTLAALDRHRSVVHPLLLQRLRDKSVHAQWGALYALALMERLPVDALPILLRALGSQDGDVRWAAAHMLVRMMGQPGVANAVRAVAGTGGAAQRKMAAYCLRDFGLSTSETESALLGRLMDEHPDVRLAAVAGLSRVACDRVRVTRELISLIFKDPHQGVRRAAAVALGRLGNGSPDVISALRRAARGADISLRRAAERSLLVLRV